MNIRALVTLCLIVVVPTEGVYLKTPEDKKGVWLTQDPSWVVYTCCNPAYINGVTHDATEALDGDIRTYWNPWSGEGRYYNNWYIVLDLAAPHTLTRIAVNNEGDRARSIASFTLQKSQVRISNWVGSPYNWEDVKSVGNVQIGTNRRQEFGGFRGTARYWRFLVTRTHKGWQPFLA
ncbi:uncharacterized protein [Branchiostoma lanceolatum]|uniref:uncharacterized protein isoform X1 n=1 Tax=Branchiostoma lanceolatum TaxID=7740 RepID=UPI0034526B1E